MWGIAKVIPHHVTVYWLSTYLCFGLFLAGTLCAALGVLAFRRAGTTVDPRVPEQSAILVTSGIYRVSRNPMYLGFLCMLCGWAACLGSVFSLVGVVLFVLYMNRFQIATEERYMQEKFGAVYLRYKTQVRRWL